MCCLKSLTGSRASLVDSNPDHATIFNKVFSVDSYNRIVLIKAFNLRAQTHLLLLRNKSAQAI